MPTFGEILIMILNLPWIVPPLVGIIVGLSGLFIRKYLIRERN